MTARVAHGEEGCEARLLHAGPADAAELQSFALAAQGEDEAGAQDVAAGLRLP